MAPEAQTVSNSKKEHGKNGKRIYMCIICLSAICFLAGCTAVEAMKKDEPMQPMPELCAQELRDCFGEEYLLSEGVEKEEHFFDEESNEEIVTYYTEWELTYQDADRQDCIFVFSDVYGRRMPPSERMEKFISRYFSDLVEEHYKQEFWNEMVAEMPGCREEDSVLYFKEYRLFSYPSVPETEVMFKERLDYTLAEHIYFPQLKYTDVCSNFPYILNLYLYVDYVSSDELERAAQRQDTEKRLREMIDAMIQYTGESLNATASVTMRDENGFVDNFSIAVLNGAYFENGRGLEYEIALHENFFGPIEVGTTN